MKAAIVTEAGKSPVYADFREPIAGDGQTLVTVTATALSRLTKSRASGAHYSSHGQFPFIAGVDGVGRTIDGTRVFFVLPDAPFGAMAERVAVRTKQCIAIPDEVDDVTAAAIGNPGLSSWAALNERARLKVGETVLINGGTGTSGRLAIQIAKHLGTKKVIATGRNPIELAELESLGADVIISLTLAADELKQKLIEQFKEGVDIVLDYLWGESAKAIIMAGAVGGKDGVPIRFVQIGAVSGNDITLPSAALRASDLLLMGSGIGSIGLDGIVSAIQGVLRAVAPAKLKIRTVTIPLERVEQTWEQIDTKARVVYTL